MIFLLCKAIRIEIFLLFAKLLFVRLTLLLLFLTNLQTNEHVDHVRFGSCDGAVLIAAFGVDLKTKSLSFGAVVT